MLGQDLYLLVYGYYDGVILDSLSGYFFQPKKWSSLLYCGPRHMVSLEMSLGLSCKGTRRCCFDGFFPFLYLGAPSSGIVLFFSSFQ